MYTVANQLLFYEFEKRKERGKQLEKKEQRMRRPFSNSLTNEPACQFSISPISRGVQEQHRPPPARKLGTCGPWTMHKRHRVAQMPQGEHGQGKRTCFSTDSQWAAASSALSMDQGWHMGSKSLLLWSSKVELIATLSNQLSPSGGVINTSCALWSIFSSRFVVNLRLDSASKSNFGQTTDSRSLSPQTLARLVSVVRFSCDWTRRAGWELRLSINYGHPALKQWWW